MWLFTEHSYYSFKEAGLLERLEASNKYVLPYELEKQYYEEMQAAIKEVEKQSKKKILESKKQITRQMLAKGLKIKLICETTGLSEEQVNKLQQWRATEAARRGEE